MPDDPHAPANAACRAENEPYFVEENIDGSPEETLSPLGRFKLTVRTYVTKPGCWSYSRGTVHRVVDGAVVCDIKRNYGIFHHTFVEKDGREYLVAGRSYMSQTIVDLDRGLEYEPPGDHYAGGAFCWAKCYLSPDGRTLAVDGCHWACPYEFRFFDFTDPAKGWKSLPFVGAERIEDPSDRSPPRWLDAITFECHHLVDGTEAIARTRLQRRGDEMHVTEQSTT